MLSNNVYKTNNFRILQVASNDTSSASGSSSDETIKEHNPQGGDIIPTFNASTQNGTAVLQKSYTSESSVNDSNPNTVN